MSVYSKALQTVVLPLFGLRRCVQNKDDAGADCKSKRSLSRSVSFSDNEMHYRLEADTKYVQCVTCGRQLRTEGQKGKSFRLRE